MVEGGFAGRQTIESKHGPGAAPIQDFLSERLASTAGFWQHARHSQAITQG